MDLTRIEERLAHIVASQQPHDGGALWRDIRDLVQEVKRQDVLLRTVGLGAAANGDRCPTCRRIGAEIIDTL